MSFRVSLVPNNLRKDDKLVPRPAPRDTTTFKALLEYMELGTALGRGDMELTMEHFAAALAVHLSRGNRVHTPIGSFALYVRRRSNSRARVDSSALEIRFRPKPAYQAEIRRNTRVEIVDTQPFPLPAIDSIINHRRGHSSPVGYIDDAISLAGARLRFNEGNPNLGVFLVDTENDIEVRCDSYTRVQSNRVAFQVPEVPAGSYELQVRTHPTKGRIRVGAMKERFEVLGWAPR